MLDATGYYAWNLFRKGNYEITVSKAGHESVTETVSIWDPTALSYELTEIIQGVSHLYVSSTGWAKWNGGGNSQIGNRHFEHCDVMLTDTDDNVIYSGTTTNNYIQLPVEGLVEGTTYRCKVANVYSSVSSALTTIDWVYQSCDNYEGASNLTANTVDNGNLVSWTYPEVSGAKANRGSTVYACIDGTWGSYDIDDPTNYTAINSMSLFGGDYCGFDGNVYATLYSDWYKIEPQTGTILESGSLSVSSFYDCAWDYTTNTMYGNNNNELYTWDVETGTTEQIGNMGVSIEVLAFDLSGQLYGIAVGDPAPLYRINKADASIEFVGYTGQPCEYYWQSGSIDLYTGFLYWANVNSYGTSLVKVDLNTGEGTVLYTEIGTQTSLSIPYAGDLFVLGAMVYRDDELIGFTNEDNYLDEGATDGHEYSLRVVYGGAGVCPDQNIYYSMSCMQTAGTGGETQTTPLSQNWNWWSTYIETEGIDAFGMLGESLGDDGITIKSQTLYSDFYLGYGWYGTLTSINNESSYRIDMNNPHDAVITGVVANPSEHPITLNHGSNWIGYISDQPLDVNVALAGLENTASLGDMLKTQGSFTEFYPGYGWYGSLNTLEPGMGLVYFSESSTSMTFTYPSSGAKSRELKANLSGIHWVPNTHAYPDNMTIVAVVELNGIEVADDNYELAAFANGECRGSVKLTYVEPVRRYMAFLTVAGDEAAELDFAIYNNETGFVCYEAEEKINFCANNRIGHIDEPFVVSFGCTTAIDEWTNNLKVYPNSESRGEKFGIGMEEFASQPVCIEIVNTLGVTVSSKTSAQLPATIAAPTTSGVYTVKIIIDNKTIYCKKLVVR